MQCDPRASKRLVLLDAREKASDRAEFCSFVPNAHAAQTFDVLFHVEVILKHTFLDPAAWAALGCRVWHTVIQWVRASLIFFSAHEF